MGIENGLCMGIITEKSAVGKLFDATHTDLGSRSGSRSGINNVKSKNYLIPGSDPRSGPGSGPGSGSFSPMLVLESAVESPTERMSVPLIFYDENENQRERGTENGRVRNTETENGRGNERERGTETGTERDTENGREMGREEGRGTENGNGRGTVKDRIRAIETTSATTSGKERDLGVVQGQGQNNLISIVENEFGSGSKKNSSKNLSTPKNISPQISPQKNEIKNEINKIKDVKDVEKIEKNIVVLPKKKKDVIRVNNLVVTGDSLDDDESHLKACID